jgi:hypothetical protein
MGSRRETPTAPVPCPRGGSGGDTPVPALHRYLPARLERAGTLRARGERIAGKSGDTPVPVGDSRWLSAGDLGLCENVEPEPWERTAPAPPRSDRRDESDHDDDRRFFFGRCPRVPLGRLREKNPPAVGNRWEVRRVALAIRAGEKQPRR